MLQTLAAILLEVMSWISSSATQLTSYLIVGFLPSVLVFLKGFFQTSPILCIGIIILTPFVLPFFIPVFYTALWLIVSSIIYFILRNPLKLIFLTIIAWTLSTSYVSDNLNKILKLKLEQISSHDESS